MQRDDERVSATGFSTKYWEKSDKKLERRRVSIERADLSQVARAYSSYYRIIRERRVGRSQPGGQPRAIIQLWSYNCHSYGFTSPQTLMRNNPQKRRKILWRYLLILLFFLHLYLTHRDPRSIWTDVHCQVATWFIMDSAMRRKGLLSKDGKSLFYNFEKNFYSEIIIWHLFKKNIDLEGYKPILSLLWGGNYL